MDIVTNSSSSFYPNLTSCFVHYMVLRCIACISSTPCFQVTLEHFCIFAILVRMEPYTSAISM